MLCCVACFTPRAFAADSLTLDNPGFESDLTGWSVAKSDAGMSKVAAEAAHSGDKGLRVTDDSDTSGSEMQSAKVPAVAGKNYQTRFWGKSITGEGVAVYLVFFDDADKPLTKQEANNEILFLVPKAATEWQQFLVKGTAPEGTASVRIRIHSFVKAMATADIDDFVLTQLD